MRRQQLSKMAATPFSPSALSAEQTGMNGQTNLFTNGKLASATTTEGFPAPSFQDTSRSGQTNTMNLRRLQLAMTLASLAAMVGSLSLYILALLINPEYTLGSNSFSKLGTAVIGWPFNMANVLGGLSTMTFAGFALRPAFQAERPIDRLAMNLLAFAGFNAVLMAPISTDYYWPHLILAGLFFLSAAAAFSLLVRALARLRCFGQIFSFFCYITAILIFSMIGSVICLILSNNVQFLASEGWTWDVMSFRLETSAVFAIVITVIALESRYLYLLRNGNGKTARRLAVLDAPLMSPERRKIA